MKTPTALLASAAGMLALALLTAHPPLAAADHDRTAQIDRGRRLVVEVGLCVDCHAPRLANGDYDRQRWLQGGPLPFKPVAEMPWNPVAPPIAGLPTLKDEEAITFLMTGVRPNGTTPLPPMPAYRLSRQEATDVVAYLRSVAPAKYLPSIVNLHPPIAMPAYCFFDVLEITDAEKMDAYRARVFECVARHGGKYLVVGGPLEVVEGHWRPAFPVIIEFPSLAAAHRWYDSADYAPLKALRLAATRANAVFLESFTPPAA